MRPPKTTESMLLLTHASKVKLVYEQRQVKDTIHGLISTQGKAVFNAAVTSADDILFNGGDQPLDLS